MKKETRKEMKDLMIQSLQEYFKQSGISEILIKMYNNSLRQVKKQKATTSLPKKKKVTNIIETNKKTMGKIKQLRQLENPKTYMSDEDDMQMPILKSSNSNRVNPMLRAKLIQNMDSAGGSILDEQLPEFLAAGLKKAKLNAQNK